MAYAQIRIVPGYEPCFRYVMPQYQLYYAVVWVLLVLLGMGPKCEPHPGRIFDILLIKYSQAFLWQGLLYIQV